ncbi:hypothetical protein MKW92_052749 [Papaver armeniacum]|nr:hypothetical protein MKW92_052749 [Papaver armeniacum]
MLSTISSDALQGDQQQWISQQLELEEHDPKKILKYASYVVKGVDARVSEMDKNVQNQIAEQKENKLKDLAEIRVRFQAGNFDVKVEVFEELKQKISSEEKLMDSLAQRSRTYYDTLLHGVGDLSTLRLQLEFKRLLRDDEKDLLLRWSKTTQDVMKLAQDEKERLQEARLRSLMARPSY